MSSTGQYGRLGRLDSISIIEARTKQLLSFRELKAKIADHVELLRNSASSKGWHVQWEPVPPGEESDPP